MKSVQLLTLFILLLPLSLGAQSLDCSSKLKLLHPAKSYTYNMSSKSAACLTGKKYEFMLSLSSGKDYRISFFASSVFNNKINFRIIDTSSGNKVLDLPGESDDARKGSCVLREYLDKDKNKMIHPYFDFHPNSTTTLKIIIDVLEKEQEEVASAGGYNSPKDVDKGCITVFIQDREAEQTGF